MNFFHKLCMDGYGHHDHEQAAQDPPIGRRAMLQYMGILFLVLSGLAKGGLEANSLRDEFPELFSLQLLKGEPEGYYPKRFITLIANPGYQYYFFPIGASLEEGIGQKFGSNGWVGALVDNLFSHYQRVLNVCCPSEADTPDEFLLARQGRTSRDILNMLLKRQANCMPLITETDYAEGKMFGWSPQGVACLSVAENDIADAFEYVADARMGVREALRYLRGIYRELGSNMQQILLLLQMQPNLQIMVKCVPDMTQTPAFRKLAGGWAPEAAPVLELYRRLCNTLLIQMCLDRDICWASMEGHIPQTDLSADGFHPNDAGYALMADRALNYIHIISTRR